MRHLFLALILPFLVTQTLGLAAPFRYCLEDGELCCWGWTPETCCEESDGPGPGLAPADGCSDVETSLTGLLLGGAPRVVASPSVAAVPILMPAPAPAPLAAAAAAGPPLPHLASTVLRR
jgi:hypothetical protein